MMLPVVAPQNVVMRIPSLGCRLREAKLAKRASRREALFFFWFLGGDRRQLGVARLCPAWWRQASIGSLSRRRAARGAFQLLWAVLLRASAICLSTPMRSTCAHAPWKVPGRQARPALPKPALPRLGVGAGPRSAHHAPCFLVAANPATTRWLWHRRTSSTSSGTTPSGPPSCSPGSRPLGGGPSGHTCALGCARGRQGHRSGGVREQRGSHSHGDAAGLCRRGRADLAQPLGAQRLLPIRIAFCVVCGDVGARELAHGDVCARRFDQRVSAVYLGCHG